MKIKFLDGSEREIADLSGADLGGADLSGADLSGADLGGANLIGANLRGAYLRSANLRSANLRSANLRSANLSYANLISAYLGGANLISANLRGANLHSANLHSANLRGAYLIDANLRGAYLIDANLKNAKGLAQQTVAAPHGPIVGFKKLKSGAIATLLIPADAKRVNAYGSRKCRAEFAYVQQLDAPSTDAHTGKTRYQQGTLITPDKYNPDPRFECSNGIHFFITREEAEDYGA